MSLRPGSRLGPYEVLSLLGQGGMGQVYRARDSRLGRDVAIKVLLADRAADREAIARFEREARSVAALSHPNILSVFDVGVDAGMLFIVGELLEGETLRARLSRGPLPWRKAIDVAAAMASGLAAAHDKGIVHRDLKPENVFLTADGQVKILDFGLARLDPRRDSGQATTHTVETDPGSVLGTTGYMSPEQVRGESVDVRSDLFSLGSVLYEMVTGARAFARGTGVETMAAILNAEPPDVTGSGKNVPPDLGLVIHHCLEKSPRERYQSASDLAFALKALASASGSTAAVVPIRRRMPAMALALVIVAAAGAIAFAVLAVWHPSSGSTTPAPALKTTLITNSGRDSEPSISPDGKFVAYVSEDNGKQSIWMHQFATHADVQLVPASDLQYHRPVFSPDGAFVYYNVTDTAQLSSAIYRVASIGGAPRLFLRNVVDGPAFSPDGSALLFSREAGSIGEISIFVAHADGTAERKLHSVANGFAGSVDWSPAGDAILVASMSGKSDMGLSVISVKDGTERVLGARRWKSIEYPAWRAATGILLVGAAEGGNQIWHVDPASGDARQLTHDVGRFSSLSVSADGDTVVADQGRRDGAIWVGTPDNAASWKRITTGAGLADGIRGLSWTTDGRLLYSAPGTGGGQIWVMVPDGSGRRQLTSGSGDHGFPRMSPDGRFIACTSRGSGRSTLSRMDPDGDHLTVIATEDFLGAATWSPDSRALVYMASGKTGLRVKRVSVDGGAAVDVSDRLINAPSVSPDGLSVAALVEGEHQQLHPAIVPFPGGGAPRLLEAGPGFQAAQGVRWLPDGQALAIVRQARGVDNVWRLPVNGGKPTQMTSFTSDEINHCAWTQDGRTWACARGHAIVEIVRITGFRALVGAK